MSFGFFILPSYDKHSCVFWYSFLSVQYHLIFLPIIVVLFNIPSCRFDIIWYSFLSMGYHFILFSSVCYSLIFLHVGALSLIFFPRFAILWNSFLSVCFPLIFLPVRVLSFDILAIDVLSFDIPSCRCVILLYPSCQCAILWCPSLISFDIPSCYCVILWCPLSSFDILPVGLASFDIPPVCVSSLIWYHCS